MSPSQAQTPNTTTSPSMGSSLPAMPSSPPSLRASVALLLARASSYPCSAAAPAFARLAAASGGASSFGSHGGAGGGMGAATSTFQLALDALLPVLDPPGGCELTDRILVSFILFALYAPHPIAINPFKSVLVGTFVKEREKAVRIAGGVGGQQTNGGEQQEVLNSSGQSGVAPNEPLVWVLWKILKGDGEDIGPYSPTALARSLLPPNLRATRLSLDADVLGGFDPDVLDAFPANASTYENTYADNNKDDFSSNANSNGSNGNNNNDNNNNHNFTHPHAPSANPGAPYLTFSDTTSSAYSAPTTDASSAYSTTRSPFQEDDTDARAAQNDGGATTSALAPAAAFTATSNGTDEQREQREITPAQDAHNAAVAHAMRLLLDARGRVLSLGEGKRLTPLLPALARSAMLTTRDLAPLVAHNAPLAHPLFVALLAGGGDAGDNTCGGGVAGVNGVNGNAVNGHGTNGVNGSLHDDLLPPGTAPYLDVLARLPPTLPTFDLLGRLLRDGTIVGGAPGADFGAGGAGGGGGGESNGIGGGAGNGLTTTVAALVRTHVLGRFVAESVAALERAEEARGRGWAGDGEESEDAGSVGDGWELGVRRLCRFYSSLIKLSIVAPEVDADSAAIAHFSLRHARFEEARALYGVLAVGAF
ncbi:hypothetical protein C8J57DRAFT_1469256 [Mycena rebaudengoi]|nr:hypothetical protein C8J57DRAFT_1469256 [Mycena rebaudengoi]